MLYYFHFRSVRRTFDRVSNNSSDVINLTQCQTALVALGYTSGIVSISVIKQVLAYFDAVCQMYDGKAKSNRSPSAIYKISNGYDDDNITITFDGFCILESYLSVLQQEIQETSCVSPIKGTNLQQPPIYLTDVQGQYNTCYWSKWLNCSYIGLNCWFCFSNSHFETDENSIKLKYEKLM